MAAYAQEFLEGVRLCTPAGLVAAAVGAANADAADQAAAGVQARPGQHPARTGYAAAAARSPGHEPGRGAPGGCVTLIVMTLAGRSCPISVPRAGTVAHIMRAVADSEDIPAKQQRLIFNGRQLEMYSFL